MNMSGESLLVILFVGLIAGWLAGHIVRGTGFGVLGDLVVGIIGAFIGLVAASDRYPAWCRTHRSDPRRHDRRDPVAALRQARPRRWLSSGQPLGHLGQPSLLEHAKTSAL